MSAIQRIETVGDGYYKCSHCNGTASDPGGIIHGEYCNVQTETEWGERQ